jgi:hypothetical protein
MSRTIGERTNNTDEFYRRMGDNWNNNLRVAIPGIIQSFNAIEQTVTVKPALREKIRNLDLSEEWVELPLLVDVPIVLPRAGGFILTMPIQQGDECLIIFADMCIDAWFSNSGLQNQIEKRRHDLSDAFAVLGAWSQPRVIENYAIDAVQLRTEDGTAYIQLKHDEIDLVASVIKKNGTPL